MGFVAGLGLATGQAVGRGDAFGRPVGLGAGIGLEMARMAHSWSEGGVGSRQGGKAGGIFVGNPDGDGPLVGVPVGCGGVDGQAVGLAGDVCLWMLCAGPSVVGGLELTNPAEILGQNLGCSGHVVGGLVGVGMVVGVLGGLWVILGVVGRVAGRASASTWLVSEVRQFILVT